MSQVCQTIEDPLHVAVGKSWNLLRKIAFVCGVSLNELKFINRKSYRSASIPDMLINQLVARLKKRRKFGTAWSMLAQPEGHTAAPVNTAGDCRVGSLKQVQREGERGVDCQRRALPGSHLLFVK